MALSDKHVRRWSAYMTLACVRKYYPSSTPKTTRVRKSSARLRLCAQTNGNYEILLRTIKEHLLNSTRPLYLFFTTAKSNSTGWSTLVESIHLRLRNLLIVALSFSALVPAAQAQAPGAAVSYMDPVGGFAVGASQYQAQCGPTANLMGFELRAGTLIDAIRPVCVVTYGATAIGNQVVSPSWNGGTGGHAVQLLCPTSTPIVIAIDVAISAVGDMGTSVLSGIRLYCGQAITAQKPPALPSAVFAAPGGTSGSGFIGIPQVCPAGMVAVGIHGKAGTWLDNLGLICGAPRKDTSGVALGRIQPTAPPGPAMSICDRAKDARARNSPIAAQLEAQCKASTPPKTLGRIMAPAGDSVPVPICDQAQSARARNSPIAPQLEARCRAVGGGQGMPLEKTPDQLAADGKLLADADPLAAELRKRQPIPNQRGFDIGMAAADGQTTWGPDKQKMLAALSGPQQEGFKVAVSYSIDRNRNPALAATGAAIAKADPAVAKARTADPEVRAWLGFDIASGIFGDPAKGAQNKMPAMQSMAIREQLSLPAQRGFNASMKLHQSRHYAAK
jgi:hypothetical protein